MLGIICMWFLRQRSNIKSRECYREELSKELRQQYGESTLYQMMLSKALLDKYKVSDEEAKSRKKQKIKWVRTLNRL